MQGRRALLQMFDCKVYLAIEHAQGDVDGVVGDGKVRALLRPFDNERQEDSPAQHTASNTFAPSTQLQERNSLIWCVIQRTL